MKKKANIFNLQKESMGAKSMDYRPEFTWMSLEDIESGKSSEWNNFSSLNSSLNLAIKEFSLVFKSKYMDYYQNRFNASPEMIERFFKIYVGYHPAYGLYLMSIGPYRGNKPEINDNRFGYFTQRLTSTDSDSIRNFLSFFVNSKDNNFSKIERDLGLSETNRKRNVNLPYGMNLKDDGSDDRISGTSVLTKVRDQRGRWTGEMKREGIWKILDETDFKMTIKHRTGERRGDGGSQWGRMVYEIIDIDKDYLSKNDYESAINNDQPVPYSTVIGTDSTWKLKPSGIFKIIKAFSSQPDQAKIIQSIGLRLAKKYNIANNEISKYLQNDESFAEEFCSLYGNNNRSVSGIYGEKIFGAQQTTALKTSADVVNTMKLEKEILEAIISVGVDEPKTVTDFINKDRFSRLNKKQRETFKPIDEGFVAYIINDIKNYSFITDDQGNIVEQKGYEEILPEFTSNLEAIVDERGFFDMDSAMRAASLYVGSAIQNALPFEDQYQNKMVDPVTKAKLIKIPEIFDPKTLDRNFNSFELEEIQQGVFSEDEQESDIDEFDVDEIEDITEENKGDYLTEEEQKLLGFDVIDKTPEVAEEEMVDVSMPSVKTLPDSSEVSEEEEAEKKGIAVSRTLNSLIKIAKDLRFQGKNRSAIGVEMIIKKYQGK